MGDTGYEYIDTLTRKRRSVNPIDRYINNFTALSGKNLDNVLLVRLTQLFPSNLVKLIM